MKDISHLNESKVQGKLQQGLDSVHALSLALIMVWDHILECDRQTKMVSSAYAGCDFM